MAIHGYLELYADHASEGRGDWCFHDERFIHANTSFFLCRKCNVSWNKEEEPDGPSGKEHCFPTNWPRRKLFRLPCRIHGHDFVLYPEVLWSMEGLHALADGDELTIYDKENKEVVIWSGTISLRHYPCEKEAEHGVLIVSDQKGTDRSSWIRWLLDHYPAQLEPGKRLA